MDNRPNIRFKGFIDDWEQRKLGEVFVEYSEKNHEELPALTIIQGGGTILREESDRALQYDKSSLSNYKMVRKDDFIVHLRSFEGGLEKANTNGIISPAYHTFHGDNTDTRFYYPFFRSRRFIDVLLKPHVYGIRDGKSIDIDGMKSIMIPVPSYNEQKKIGDYIETLDNLITLHQRKCDETKELKKFMLQKMFPKNGEKKPEIRFTGFIDDWEQRKLGEIADCLDSMRVPINSEEREKIPGNIPYYGAGNIQGYIDKYLFDEELVLLLEDGDAFDDYQTKSIAQYITGKTWVNNHAHVLRPHGHAYFLYSILAHKDIRQWTQLAGASRKKLVQDAMLNISVLMPSGEEQTKIGNYFYNLDNLITLHQRKCDEIKEVKKYMLQNLFVK